MSLPPLLWKPSPNFSERNARVDLLVLHDCEGGYAAPVNWFLMKESQVSAHFVCKEDGSEVTQMVELADKAWHACNFNSRSVGWEMGGYAAKGFSDALLDTTALAFAYLCHHLQIPVRHARGGVGPGIESHWGLGAAGGGHSDPSRDPAFMDSFVARVAAHAARGDFPALWEPAKDAKPCALNPKVAALDLSTTAGVQHSLNSLGYLCGNDATLQAAVCAFQRKAGIAVDGIVGPETKFALTQALSGG
jgi:N-acetyl-anhydromuramyl-L-alanine amidase AmpD